jgi:hypothetical protein
MQKVIDLFRLIASLRAKRLLATSLLALLVKVLLKVADRNEGAATAIKIAITATLTSSSIRVKPCSLRKGLKLLRVEPPCSGLQQYVIS